MSKSVLFSSCNKTYCVFRTALELELLCYLAFYCHFLESFLVFSKRLADFSKRFVVLLEKLVEFPKKAFMIAWRVFKRNLLRFPRKLAGFTKKVPDFSKRASWFSQRSLLNFLITLTGFVGILAFTFFADFCKKNYSFLQKSLLVFQRTSLPFLGASCFLRLEYSPEMFRNVSYYQELLIRALQRLLKKLDDFFKKACWLF